MKKLTVIILLILSVQITNAQDEKLKKELEKLSWDWMNAWKSKDTVLLEKLLAPEYRLLALINGQLITIPKQAWLKTAKVYIPSSFRYYDFDIRLYGNTAVVQSMFDQVATLNGQDRSGTFQITDIWVKKKIGWQVVHRQTNLKVQQQTEEAKIYDVVMKIGKAWSETNLDTLEKYIDKRYLHTDVSGQTLNRAHWMNDVKERKLKNVVYPGIEFQDIDIKVYDDMALVTGANIFSGNSIQKLRFTQVMKKENNIWKRLAFQATYSTTK